MFDAHKNFGYSTVATAPSPATSGTSVTVATGDGANFPDPSTDGPFNVVIWPSGNMPASSNAEIARCTARSGDVLTITRAVEGSSARTVVTTDQIAANVTAKTFTDIEGQIADGWIDDTYETWTYASGSGGGTATFTVPGDQTAKYKAGTRIRLTQTTVKYFVVTKDATVAAGTTTVTISAGTDYTLANAAITANYHSYAANPQGYPGWFAFAPSVTGFSGSPTQAARFSVTGHTCSIELWFQGTSNATTMTFTLPIAASTALGQQLGQIVRVQNSGAFAAGLCNIDPSTPTTCSFYVDGAGHAFTNSGTKGASAMIYYEI